jgi:hypothetical protein
LPANERQRCLPRGLSCRKHEPKDDQRSRKPTAQEQQGFGKDCGTEGSSHPAAGLSAERTLREIARVAYADPRRLFRADGTLVPIVELDEDAAGMIAAIEVDEDGRTTKVRMWDKNQALEKALKYLGLYERDNAQHSENLELQVVLVGKP